MTMTALPRDLRYALRGWRRVPGFALALGLSLAGGVAAGTALLGLLLGGLRRSVPYTDQHPLDAVPRGGWLGERTPHLRTIPEVQDPHFATLLGVVLALTALLLLVAAVNVGVLLLARGSTRHTELALRAVLGAAPRRLARQLLSEGGLFVALTATLGAVLGGLAARGLLASWPGQPVAWDAAPSGVAVGLAVAGGAALLALGCWLLPALAGLRRDLRSALAVGERATAGRGEGQLRGALVAVQFAAALVLLAGGGLLLRGFADAGQAPRDLGLDPRDTLTLQLRLDAPHLAQPAARAALFAHLQSQVAELPGVVDSSLASTGAWVGLGPTDLAHALLQVPARPGIVKPARYHAVSPGHFRALGTPLLRGREFTPADTLDAPRVVVVSELFAFRLFPGLDPIGKRVQLGSVSITREWYTVVGVARDVRAPGIGNAQETVPALYLSALQHPPRAVGLAVRTRGEPRRHAAAVVAALRRADSSLAPRSVGTLAEELERFRAPLRWFARLLGAMAAVALALALTGLYAAVSLQTERRTREFGVRLALGARARDLVLLVLRGSARTVAWGVGLGLFGLLPLARLLQLRFHGVDPLDLGLYAALAALLAAVALLAALRPALRAARTDPALVLRAE